MGHQIAASNKRRSKLLATLAAGALTTVGLTSAPGANATCASFFGINSGGNCTSSQTSIAIAIGTNAQAHAIGLFGSAFAVGTNAIAATDGALDLATTVGDNSVAGSFGVFGMATQLGSNGVAATDGQGLSHNQLGLNFALNVSFGTTAVNGSLAEAYGIGNVAINLFGNGTVTLGHLALAYGTLNGATTLGGTNNIVSAGLGTGTANYAFGVLGSGNQVKAGPGPVAIAGSILQTGANITKQGPGFNINGFKVGGAAATPPVAHAKPAASGVGHPKSH
jgi:hypothetical protein